LATLRPIRWKKKAREEKAPQNKKGLTFKSTPTIPDEEEKIKKMMKICPY